MSDVAESISMHDAEAALAENHAMVLTEDHGSDVADGVPTVPAIREDDLSLEQALDFVSDDERESTPARASNQPIAKVDDRALTLPELVNGYVAGQELKDIVYGVDARYDQILAAANDIAFSAAALADYLASQLPPSPPVALSFSNPSEFIQQKVVHETAHKRLMAVLESAQLARQQGASIAAQRQANALQRENHRLITHFPQCAEPEGRERFFDAMREVAYHCDFTEEELRQVVDHRIFRLAHLAAVAIKAGSHSRNEPIQQKQRKSVSSSDALERLEATGSIADAMAVEFD